MNKKSLTCPTWAPDVVKAEWSKWSEPRQVYWIRTNQFLKPVDHHICGVFKKVVYSDGPDWIVQLNHPHKEGDIVKIEKKDGMIQFVLLSKPLEVEMNGRDIPNCFCFVRNTMFAVKNPVNDAAEQERKELERMLTLPTPSVLPE